MRRELSRRALLRGGTAALGGAALGMGLADAAGKAAGAAAQFPRYRWGSSAAVIRRGTLVGPLLPSPMDMREEIGLMVGRGPRFTASTAHDRHIEWMMKELSKAGCRLLAPDEYGFERWLAEDYSLEVLEGPNKGKVRIAAYYPYGGETPPQGVVGRLVTPAQVQAGTAGANGNVILVDTGLPSHLTEGSLGAMLGMESMNWPNDTWRSRNYRRMWLAAGKGGNLPGAVGAVYILDASYEACAGNYAPFGQAYQGFPAVYVDRDTGRTLLQAARGNPRVHFLMAAAKKRVTSPSLVATLEQGRGSDEVMIVNTHTDGPNFAEENGTVALVALARYFSKVPANKKLSRTLVFSAVTGHFGPQLPQTQGFVEHHPDFIRKAHAALTIEHFGSTEWWDTSRGYFATGFPEVAVAYHARTKALEDAVISSIKEFHLLQTAAVPAGKLYFGVGGPIQDAGVPEVSFIAGPNYLVATGMPTPKSPYHGQLHKLNPTLAANQVAWSAERLVAMDAMTKADLRGPTTPV